MTAELHKPTDQSQKSGATKPRKPTSAYRRFRRMFSKTQMRVPFIWYRHHGLRPTDVFFASYPRSGTTWSRCAVYEILTGRPSTFTAVNKTLCGVGRHANSEPLLPGDGRIISTHEQYRKEYTKAIYVVRDCRDVLLSEFAYLKALDFFKGDLDEFVKIFVSTRVSGFGPWYRHVASWLDSPLAGTDKLLVVRFEDLRQDAPGWFAKIVKFLGVEVSQEQLLRAVANNSLEGMREKERREPVKASVKGRFVGEGNVRGWRSKLTPAQLELIEKYAGDALLRLGHPLSGQLTDFGAEGNSALEPSVLSSKGRVLS
jgi:hypothetical protein